MTLDPLALPLRPSEANELANLVFDLAEGRPLTQEIRNRIASRAAALKLRTLQPHLGSLSRDPIHHSTYYVAVDVADGPPLLLHIAVSGAPTSSLFQKPLLIGRMRRAAGQEIVINAVAFSPADRDLVARFAAEVDDALLPKVQGTRPAIVAAPSPASFDAFRTILKRTGRNLAAIEMSAGEFEVAIYYAIRAGWREGYSAGLTLDAATARDSLRDIGRFTRFRIEAAQAPAEASPDEYASQFPPFGDPVEAAGESYRFDAGETAQIAARLGPALRACERLHEWIRQARAAAKGTRAFDFEAVLPVHSARELVFCLHWLKTRGRAPQLLAPRPPAGEDFEAKVREMAAIARHYSCQLCFDADCGGDLSKLELISRASAGRVNFRVTGGSAHPDEYSQYLIGLADILLG